MPTRAPTPEATFKPGVSKVVVRTTLRGFTRKTFTRGIRYAYRKAFAKRHRIQDITLIIITNIRDTVPRRARRARRLAAAGVEFDCQVMAQTSAAAESLSSEIKDGDAAEEAKLLDEFKVEIKAVAQDSEYDDVPAGYLAPAALAVSEASGVVTLETRAPTPVPAVGSGSGGGPPIGAIVGAVAGIGALAGVAVWRRRLVQVGSAKELVHAGAASNPTSTEPKLHDIYPGAISTDDEKVGAL